MLLSLQLFKRDPSSAARRLNDVADKLDQYLRRTPGEEERIINEAAFDELRANTDLVSLFPTEIRDLFLDYDSFIIFSIVRSTVAPTKLVAAYMIRADKYNSLPAAHIEGRLVPVDDLPSVFVTDAPLYTQDVQEEVANNRREIDQLKRSNVTELLAVRRDFTAEIRNAVIEIEQLIDAATRATTARRLAASAFSHVTITTELLRDTPDLIPAMELISRLGQAVYWRMLSFEVASSSDFYVRRRFGSLKIRLPPSYQDALAQSGDVRNLADGQTFHGIVGHRWLLLMADGDELMRQSDEFDANIQAFIATIPDDIRVRLRQLLDETFPSQLLFDFWGRGTMATRDTEFKRQLTEIVLIYLRLTDTITNAIATIRKWWLSRLGKVLSFTQTEEMLRFDPLIQDYVATTERLTGAGAVEAYTKLHGTIEVVMDFFNFVERARRREDVNVQDLSSIRNLSAYLESLGDYESLQRDYVKRELMFVIITQRHLANEALPTTKSIYAEVVALFALLMRHMETSDALLDPSRDVFDFRDISRDDDILALVSSSTSMARTVFFALRRFMRPDATLSDALFEYYTHLHFYYACKASTNPVPENNPYAPLAAAIRSEDGRTVVPLDRAFETQVRVPWNPDAFEAALMALRRPPVSLANISVRHYTGNVTTLLVDEQSVASMIDRMPQFISIETVLGEPGTDLHTTNIVERTLFALDRLLGGVIRYDGSVQFEDACVYRKEDVAFASVYMACLVVYTAALRGSTNYRDTRIFDLWRYLIDHFDSYTLVTQQTIEARRSVFYTVDEQAARSEVPGRIEPPQEKYQSVQQHIIQFETNFGVEAKALIYGKKRYYVELKDAIFAKYPPDVQMMIYNWISQEHLQTPCEVPEGNSRTWLTTKRALKELGDDAVVSALYYTLSRFGTMKDDSNIYRDYLIQTMRPSDKHDYWRAIPNAFSAFEAWITTKGKNNEWLRDMASTITEYGSRPGSGDLTDPFRIISIPDRAQRNEFAKVHNCLSARYAEIAYTVERFTLFARYLQAQSREVVRTIINIMDTPIEVEDKYKLKSVLPKMFRPILEKGSVDVRTALQNIMTEEKLSFSSVQALCFFAVSSLDADTAPTILSRIREVRLADGWKITDVESRMAYLFGSMTDVERKLAVPLLVAIAKSSPDNREIFAKCVDALTQRMIDGFSIVGESEVGTLVTHEEADFAIQTIFWTYHRVIARNVKPSMQHVRIAEVTNIIDKFLETQVVKSSLDAKRNLVDQLKAIAESKDDTYDVARAGVPLFKYLSKNWMVMAFTAKEWKGRLVNLCKACRTLLQYVNYVRVVRIGNMPEVFRQLCDLRVPPARVMTAFMAVSNFDAMCNFIESNQNLDQWRPDEIRPEEAFLVHINEKMTAKMPILFHWEYFFVLPSTLYIICILQYYYSFNQNSYDAGWKKHCAHILRQDVTSLIEQLERLTADEFSYERMTEQLEIINSMPEMADRMSPLPVVWNATLGALLSDLQLWSTRLSLAQATAQQPSGSALIENMTRVNVEYVGRRIAELFKREMEVDTEGSFEWDFTLLFDNPLLTDYGVHMHLGALIAAYR